MPSKINFTDKFLARLDRLDRESLQNYMGELLRNRRETEQILDRLSEGVLLVKPDGVVTYANQNAYLWLGFQRLLKNRTSLEALPEEPQLKRFFAECIKAPLRLESAEFEVLLPREMQLRVHWVPLEESEAASILIRIENRTQDKAYLEEQARAQRVQGVIRLAAGVAHEIGNPLNSIQIHLDLLKREIGQLPKKKQVSLDKFLGVIASETRRLDQTVRSFLRATRPSPLRFRKDSLNQILQESVEFLGPEMGTRRIRRLISLDEHLPPFLIDRDRIYQAFINLLKNAIEAMPKGGRIRVSTSCRERLCLVRFEDEGEGIQEKDLPHIFEAYYTTKQAGSGLGLCQVYEAVREHGGRIDVKSRAGRGTVFTLAFPVRQQRLSLPQPRPSTVLKVSPP